MLRPKTAENEQWNWFLIVLRSKTTEKCNNEIGFLIVLRSKIAGKATMKSVIYHETCIINFQYDVHRFLPQDEIEE